MRVIQQREQPIEQRAREIVSQHPHFRGREAHFDGEYCEDVLIIRGRVPTYYLKQLLQTVLKDVGGVAYLDNRVEVFQ